MSCGGETIKCLNESLQNSCAIIPLALYLVMFFFFLYNIYLCSGFVSNQMLKHQFAYVSFKNVIACSYTMFVNVSFEQSGSAWCVTRCVQMMVVGVLVQTSACSVATLFVEEPVWILATFMKGKYCSTLVDTEDQHHTEVTEEWMVDEKDDWVHGFTLCGCGKWKKQTSCTVIYLLKSRDDNSWTMRKCIFLL